MPATVTPGQLETLLNGLLQNEEKLPYSFHIEEQVWKRGGGVETGVRCGSRREVWPWVFIPRV